LGKLMGRKAVRKGGDNPRQGKRPEMWAQKGQEMGRHWAGRGLPGWVKNRTTKNKRPRTSMRGKTRNGRKAKQKDSPGGRRNEGRQFCQGVGPRGHIKKKRPLSFVRVRKYGGNKRQFGPETWGGGGR